MADASIDWDYVDTALIEGAEGVDIADKFGISRDTFYRQVEKKYGCNFAVYKQKMRSKGDDNIRQHQYRKALGLTNNGDNTLLIWLGKVRCGQKEEKNINISTDEQVPKWLQNHLNTSKDLVQDNDSKPE